MDLTQTSSSDIDQALLSSSTSEERNKLAKSFDGDWSEGEEESSSSRNQAFLKELYENKQINETSKCFLIKSRAYKDNIWDALIPALAIQLQVNVN